MFPGFFFSEWKIKKKYFYLFEASGYATTICTYISLTFLQKCNFKIIFNIVFFKYKKERNFRFLKLLKEINLKNKYTLISLYVFIRNIFNFLKVSLFRSSPDHIILVKFSVKVSQIEKHKCR